MKKDITPKLLESLAYGVREALNDVPSERQWASIREVVFGFFGVPLSASEGYAPMAKEPRNLLILGLYESLMAITSRRSSGAIVSGYLEDIDLREMAPKLEACLMSAEAYLVGEGLMRDPDKPRAALMSMGSIRIVGRNDTPLATFESVKVFEDIMGKTVKEFNGDTE